MLNFLVSSKVRRALLELLWADGNRGSVVQLAREARVGYASAYRELKAMVRNQLAVRVVDDGVETYTANVDYPYADVVRRLVATRPQVAAPHTPEADQLRRKLRRLGAPLLTEPADEMPQLEETLAKGVGLSHRDPTLARALPVCIARNRSRLDARALLAAAAQLRETHAVGFFLSLTSILANDAVLGDLATKFRDHRVRSEREFFDLPDTAYSRALADRNAPEVARQWGYRMNMDLEAFRTVFDKAVNA